jgi:hypothetical protein
VRVNKRAYHLHPSIICGYTHFLINQQPSQIELFEASGGTLAVTGRLLIAMSG